MSVALKTALAGQRAGSNITRKGLAILDEAYLANKTIPTDYDFPPQAGHLTIHFRDLARAAYVDGNGGFWPEGHTHMIWLEATPDSTVTSVLVTQSPGTVLLANDAAHGIVGEPDNGMDPVPATPENRVIWLHADVGDDPATGSPNETLNLDGFYSIALAFADGSTAFGWFIVSHALPSSNPTFHVPAEATLFDTPTPTFEISAFQSPEFVGIEDRALGLDLNSADGDHLSGPGQPSPLASVWRSFATNPPGPIARTIGGSPGSGAGALSDGPYRLTASFSETREFGPLTIARDAAIETEFYVAAQARATCAALPDGNYCGHDGVHADPATVYACRAGALSVVGPCPGGCTSNQPAADDACVPCTVSGLPCTDPSAR
jgi:hypothetical protein